MKEGAPAGTVIAGRYEVKAEIGRGGMGVVYEVEHVNTGERLAMKVLTSAASLHTQTVARFKREARASAHIESEHVVRVTDADAAPELDGAPFLVMELLNGSDLEQHVVKNGPMAPAMLVTVLGQIGSALHAAHQLGIIHRDVKPENLFLHRRADGVVVAKVLDFGISKFAADAGVGLTTTGAFVGTPLYMAPEQAHSETDKITPATDVWALGLVTLRLLTGEHLWGSPSMAELITKIVVSPIPKPSERWPADALMSPELDAWFARSCARDPAERWSSVDDQMRSLKDALDVVPIALADTRPSGSLSVALERTKGSRTTTTASSSISSRRGLVALGVGAVAITCVFVGTQWRRAPAESGRSALEASADPAILRIEDLPASPTTSDSARTKFRSAMRLSADGNVSRARATLNSAIADDPTFASAQAQRAYLSFISAAGLDLAGRNAFRAGSENRDSLGDRDREFLNAISPAFLDPPRNREATGRLEAFVTARPGDAQGHEALGIASVFTGNYARAEQEFRAELRVEPDAGLATKLLAQMLTIRGASVEAIRLLEGCVARSTAACECHKQLAAVRAALGQCQEAETAARDAMAVDPTEVSAATLRAGISAATGASAEAVAALLEQRRALAPSAALEGDDAYALASRRGDFTAALAGLDLADTTPAQTYLAIHGRAYRRSSLLWEMGAARKSAEAANAFIDHSQTRPAPERIYGDETGRLLNFAVAGGAMTPSTFSARRGAWIQGWRSRRTDFEWQSGEGLKVWIKAFASPTAPTPDTSREALSVRDEDGGITLGGGPDPSFELSVVTAYGALLLGAERLDEAEVQLTAAARACVLVPEVRALYLLGNVYAKKNEKDKACGVYAEVEALWGHAKPRSITAEAARAEATKLGCH